MIVSPRAKPARRFLPCIVAACLALFLLSISAASFFPSTQQSFPVVWISSLTRMLPWLPSSQPSSEQQEQEQVPTRRRLTAHDPSIFENSISFLTDMVSKHMHKAQPEPSASGLSFMSPDELRGHKQPPSTPTTPTTPITPVSPPSDNKKPPEITFLTEEEKAKHKHRKRPKPRTPQGHGNGLPVTDHHHGAGSTHTSTEGLHDMSSLVSPSPGTALSLESLPELLRCPNQSKCIVPQLQLTKKVKVYFCRHPTRHGVRYYYLAREGLLLHPNVQLVSEQEAISGGADYIIYLPGSAPWHLTECNRTAYASKLIVLDEFDGPSPLFNPARSIAEYAAVYGSREAQWYDMYFKRSFVRRRDGVFVGYPHLTVRDVYPLTYSIAEAYIPHRFNLQRDIDILCTLRGHAGMKTRLRVQEWVAAYGIERNISNVVSKQVTPGERKGISMKYFQQMSNAKIIVTVNPSSWEGDFRLWEALASGALIFVDPLFVPHPFPLIHEEHVIYFSNQDQADLVRKLDYYRSHPEEAARIAHNGYAHAMKHHRTVSMIDYVLRTAHLKSLSKALESKAEDEALPKYLYTGQYLNVEARLQQSMIKKCHVPGSYETGELNAEERHRVRC